MTIAVLGFMLKYPQIDSGSINLLYSNGYALQKGKTADRVVDMVKSGEVDSPILPAVVHLYDPAAKLCLMNDFRLDHQFTDPGYDSHRLPVADPQRRRIVWMDLDFSFGMQLAKIRHVLVPGVIKQGFSCAGREKKRVLT